MSQTTVKKTLAQILDFNAISKSGLFQTPQGKVKNEVGRLARNQVKTLKPILEEYDDKVDDAMLVNCVKDEKGTIIYRSGGEGQNEKMQWTESGLRQLKTTKKELLKQEYDVTPVFLTDSKLLDEYSDDVLDILSGFIIPIEKVIVPSEPENEQTQGNTNQITQ